MADERKGYAERRLEQIGGDRGGSETRLRGLVEELEALDLRHGGGDAELERIREDVKDRAEVVAAVRGRLDKARARLEETEQHERDVARKGLISRVMRTRRKARRRNSSAACNGSIRS